MLLAKGTVENPNLKQNQRMTRNLTQFCSAVDRGDKQTDRQTDTLPLHRHLPLEAGSVDNLNWSFRGAWQ